MKWCQAEVGWVDGWVGGKAGLRIAVDSVRKTLSSGRKGGWESRVKDCLQQSKITSLKSLKCNSFFKQLHNCNASQVQHTWKLKLKLGSSSLNFFKLFKVKALWTNCFGCFDNESQLTSWGFLFQIQMCQIQSKLTWVLSKKYFLLYTKRPNSKLVQYSNSYL